MAVAIILMGVFQGKVSAQLNPAAAQYYVNQYIANPAFAGAARGTTFNGTYRALWTSIPGAPVSQNLTAEYGFEKVGIGLSLFNEKSGLLGQTRVVATYAYHLPLS
ncbi:MAG: type IX secretion system membrane protein PorP/SprF, partial [Chitinophagaceae bacterium]